MPRSWTAVTVTADAELADSIGAFLMDQGAPGLVSEDVAEGVRITAHFENDFSRDSLETFREQLQEWFPGSNPIAVSFDTTLEQDWADNWKSHFQPLAIGERLWIHPPWIAEIPTGRIGVMIDPGMAFGTGQHASTRGCLTFLDATVRAGRAQRVLDIGTGSGVLAIAAAKLGAGEARGIDIDADACRIATENVAVNEVADRVTIGCEIDNAWGRFDIVVANLFADQLAEMAALIAEHLNSGGTVIGSGILTKDLDLVVRAWTDVGLVLSDRLDEGEWTTITARRT